MSMDALDLLSIGCGVCAVAVLIVGCAWADYRYRMKPLFDDLRKHLEQQAKDTP